MGRIPISLALAAMTLAAAPSQAAAPADPFRCVLPSADGAPDPSCRRTGPSLGAPSGPLPCLTLEGIDDRCETWTASDDPSATGPGALQFPADLVLSPDGATVFAAFEEQVGEDPWTSPSTWVVAAHDAASGARRWRVSVEGLRAQSFPSALAVAGNTLYVAGSDREAFGAGESATVLLALDPSDGTERWRARFDGPGGTDNPRTMVASEDGAYVAVISANGDNADLDYVLWAVDPDGRERFATRWSGLGDGRVDTPLDIGLSPDGEMAYLTGWSAGAGEYDVDFGTVAVTTIGEGEGEIAWDARYDGEEGHGPDQAYALAVDDEHVYVTGYSNDLDAGPPFSVHYEFATLAYRADTGAMAWESRRVWDQDTWSTPTEMALAGGRVIVAGQSTGGQDTDYATQALDAATGTERWAARHELEQHDFEVPLAVAATAQRVYVTGISSSSHTSLLFGGQAALADQATVAYDAATGAPLWRARFNDSGYDDDAAVGIAVSADGSRVITLAQLVRNVQADRDFYDVGLASYQG